MGKSLKYSHCTARSMTYFKTTKYFAYIQICSMEETASVCVHFDLTEA